MSVYVGFTAIEFEETPEFLAILDAIAAYLESQDPNLVTPTLPLEVSARAAWQVEEAVDLEES